MPNSDSKGEKWTNQQIELLIDAYKDEACLYATTHVNYYNKRLRIKALERVSEQVKMLRPTATPKECIDKFHNLRNKFNIENLKVRASYDSKTSPDDIYQPSLWYYPKLLFLETYLKPRKTWITLENKYVAPDLQQDSSNFTMEDNSQHSDPDPEDIENMSVTSHQGNVKSEIRLQDDPLINNCSVQLHELNTPQLRNLSSASLSTSNSDVQQARRKCIPPGPLGVALSISPSPGTSGVSQRPAKRRRQRSSDDVFAGAIHELAESMKLPATINKVQNTGSNSTLSVDPVDSFLNFIGSLLRSIQDEELKLEAMNNITQTVINAKSTELQRAKNKN